jgi:hypothetical protein
MNLFELPPPTGYVLNELWRLGGYDQLLKSLHYRQIHPNFPRLLESEDKSRHFIGLPNDSSYFDQRFHSIHPSLSTLFNPNGEGRHVMARHPEGKAPIHYIISNPNSPSSFLESKFRSGEFSQQKPFLKGYSEEVLLQDVQTPYKVSLMFEHEDFLKASSAKIKSNI